jgi:uncharacterized protein (DUF488 family)
MKTTLRILETEGTIGRMRLVKILFLISNDPYVARSYPTYSFVPYRYGPFSFELYHDLNILGRDGFLEQEGSRIQSRMNHKVTIDGRFGSIIQRYLDETEGLNDNAMRKMIYDRFPSFTVLSALERLAIRRKGRPGIVTIGYEGRTIDKFLYLLIEDGVELVMDVRANPFSRKYAFSKSQLKSILTKVGIQYEHLPELGIPSDERKSITSQKSLRDLFKRYHYYLNGHQFLIDSIIEKAKEKRLAMMCFEKDVGSCHRGVISEVIQSRGVVVKEI